MITKDDEIANEITSDEGLYKSGCEDHLNIEYAEGSYSIFENGFIKGCDLPENKRIEFWADNGVTYYQNILAGMILLSEDSRDKIPIAMKWLYIANILGDKSQEPTYSLLYGIASKAQIDLSDQLVEDWFVAKTVDSTEIDKSGWSNDLRHFFIAKKLPS